MSGQILAKLDAIQTTIASLRAEVGGLQAQLSTKADSTAVTALSSTVRSQGGTITSQGGMITAQGKAISNLTSRIDSPCDCRKAAASADTALDTTRVQAQMYINEAAIESASIRTEVSARAEADVALASCIGALTSIPTATLESGLEVMAGLIHDLKLGEQLLSAERFGVDDGLANIIRQVIRDELKPGGMLHRS